MAVGVLIISHAGIGPALLRIARQTLAGCPLPVATICVPADCEPAAILSEASAAIAQLEQGDGVLILTDICGATPCNIARRLLPEQRVKMVTGLNLPMLIRVLNYPHLDLEQLSQCAIMGGHNGILIMTQEL